jgi:hypothetical protein
VHRYLPTLIILFFPGCSHHGAISFDSSPITVKRSIEHTMPTSGKAYLEVKLSYTPFAELRKEVEREEGVNLKNRGEAHITVVTPPEYKKMQNRISMQEINQIAKNLQMEEAPIKLICIGKGQKLEGPQLESTYYVVIQADRLFEVRRKIAQTYQMKGGLAAEFDPEYYFPHVTLGFTLRDLHLEDGIIKNEHSCVYKIKSQKP